MHVQSESKAYDDINVTPMLDLAYVLLVIFIIMTTASVQGIKVNLPKASDTPSLAKPKTKAITINNDGKIFYETYGVTMDELDQRLRQQQSVDPETPLRHQRRRRRSIQGRRRCSGTHGPAQYHPARPGDPTLGEIDDGKTLFPERYGAKTRDLRRRHNGGAGRRLRDLPCAEQRHDGKEARHGGGAAQAHSAASAAEGRAAARAAQDGRAEEFSRRWTSPTTSRKTKRRTNRRRGRWRSTPRAGRAATPSAWAASPAGPITSAAMAAAAMAGAVTAR